MPDGIRHLADSGYSSGAAFAALMSGDHGEIRSAGPEALREHVSFVREFIPPSLRGRKRDWFTTRELAWMAGLSVRTMERKLSRRNPPNGGIEAPPRPVTATEVRKLASRLPDDSVARALIEQAADSWESERPAGEHRTLPAGRVTTVDSGGYM